MYYVYVLRSLKDKKNYIGSTNDLKRRYREHLKGKNLSTQFRLPVILIYYEAFLYENEARKKEIFYKSGRGREVLRKMLFITLSSNATDVSPPAESAGSL